MKFLGFIQNEKIPYFHKAADILIAPYSSSCSTVEWMSPIKIFEYMASDVPIIASDLKRVIEICNNGECLFFKESDSSDLATKIRELFINKDLRKTLIEKASQTVKNYSYENRCQKIINFSKKKLHI